MFWDERWHSPWFYSTTARTTKVHIASSLFLAVWVRFLISLKNYFATYFRETIIPIGRHNVCSWRVNRSQHSLSRSRRRKADCEWKYRLFESIEHHFVSQVSSSGLRTDKVSIVVLPAFGLGKLKRVWLIAGHWTVFTRSLNFNKCSWKTRSPSKSSSQVVLPSMNLKQLNRKMGQGLSSCLMFLKIRETWGAIASILVSLRRCLSWLRASLLCSVQSCSCSKSLQWFPSFLSKVLSSSSF